MGEAVGQGGGQGEGGEMGGGPESSVGTKGGLVYFFGVQKLNNWSDLAGDEGGVQGGVGGVGQRGSW